MEKYGPTVVTIVEIALLVAAWTFFGSWTYSLAKRKGRNKWGWFLVGFFFTFIGVIVAWAIPPAVQPTPAGRASAAGPRREAEQGTPTMTSVAPQARDIAWGRAFLAGAVAGGFGWGLFAAGVFVAPFDQVHYGTIIEPRIPVAAFVSVVCGVIAAVLVVLGRSAPPARARNLLSAAMAFVVAVVSGWIILGLQVLQLTVSGGW